MGEILANYEDIYEHEDFDEASDYAKQILEELSDFDVLHILF